MDNQTKQVSNSVTIFTEKGKLYLQEGVKTGSKNSYHLAIQVSEYASAICIAECYFLSVYDHYNCFI